MEIHSKMAIGFLMKKLISEGVTDVAEIANALHRLKELQNQEGIYPHGRYSESGSASAATVINEYDGSKKECILWCLNHYLALNRHPEVIRRAQQALSKYGTGCGTSAMAGGMNALQKELEGRIASMLGMEKAVIFPTGYSTNLGAISALVGKNDLILFDHECHASMIDGCKLSGKEWMAFHHNDVANLETKLARSAGKYENIFVLVESAYSMSGDLSPLKEIVALKAKHKFYLYVDEAHTFGIYGKEGRGYCHEMGILDQVDFMMGTFSKSTASVGGFLATQARFGTLIQCNASSYIFQACMSPADSATVLAALDVIRDHPELIAGIHEKNRYFRGKLTGIGFDLGRSQSPVVPIYVSDLEKLYPFARDLYENGIFSISVSYPAVKHKEGRVRFTVNESHTYDQLDKTVEILAKLGRKYELVPA